MAVRSGKAERQCQSRDPRSGAQAGSVFDGDRSQPERLPVSREGKPSGSVKAAAWKNNRDSSACGLPGLASSRLGEGAQASDAPFGLFRDWQEITNSIFCGEGSWLQKQMDFGFCILQEPPPRGNNRELKDLEKLFHALLLSASGQLLPLDKDLSWMSATHT